MKNTTFEERSAESRIVITIAPFLTGDFHLANITGSWFPADWIWDLKHILILFGIFAMAEWSACAWETAAIYGPEYKNPNTDTPKALLVCGGICLVLYVLVQTSVIGTLGVEGVLSEPISPMLPIANLTLGTLGASIAIIMLIGGNAPYHPGCLSFICKVDIFDVS